LSLALTPRQRWRPGLLIEQHLKLRQEAAANNFLNAA